jgi:prepilin-type N-terminal cleavage/methylation domain-containing protein
MKKSTSLKQQGFTVIELLIASAIFSVIMLICLTAFVEIGRAYYKGVTMSRTQDVARSMIDDISRSLQFSNASVSSIGNTTYCVGNKRYTISRGIEITSSGGVAGLQGQHGVQREDNFIGGCSAATPAQLGSATELLSEGMQIDVFEVAPVSTDNKLWQIHIKIVSGSNIVANDILTGAVGAKQCVSRPGATSQFCAISDLTTIITGRL